MKKDKSIAHGVWMIDGWDIAQVFIWFVSMDLHRSGMVKVSIFQLLVHRILVRQSS